MIRNKFYMALAIIIILLFSGSIISAGCKAEETAVEEAVTTEEKEVSEINDISPEEVYEIIKNNQDYIILDVRTKEEFNEGHLEDAILIPVSELESRLDELPKDKPIITYCKSGVRSRNAANMLVENGFTQIYDMGGILDWQEEGYPVEVGE
jgi:phage shock protein E